MGSLALAVLTTTLSLWHTPQASTLMRTSPAEGSLTGTSSMLKGASFSLKSAALQVFGIEGDMPRVVLNVWNDGMILLRTCCEISQRRARVPKTIYTRAGMARESVYFIDYLEQKRWRGRRAGMGGKMHMPTCGPHCRLP